MARLSEKRRIQLQRSGDSLALDCLADLIDCEAALAAAQGSTQDKEQLASLASQLAGSDASLKLKTAECESYVAAQKALMDARDKALADRSVYLQQVDQLTKEIQRLQEELASKSS